MKWDRQIVDSGAGVQAVVVNSGIANACTGAEGFGYCKDTADAAAEALGINADGVLIGRGTACGQLRTERRGRRMTKKRQHQRIFSWKMTSQATPLSMHTPCSAEQ